MNTINQHKKKSPEKLKTSSDQAPVTFYYYGEANLSWIQNILVQNKWEIKVLPMNDKQTEADKFQYPAQISPGCYLSLTSYMSQYLVL